MVQALIGGPVRRPHRNRGAYVHFPVADVSEAQLGPHNDTHPAELFGFTIMMDVPPRSGGTVSAHAALFSRHLRLLLTHRRPCRHQCIWPGSPQLLYDCLETEQRCGFHPTERYEAVMEHIKSTVEPVEFVGKAGDVLFLHPTM